APATTTTTTRPMPSRARTISPTRSAGRHSMTRPSAASSARSGNGWTTGRRCGRTAAVVPDDAPSARAFDKNQSGGAAREHTRACGFGSRSIQWATAMIKTILVPTSGASTDRVVFDTALAAAQLFSAHIDFCHVRLQAGEALRYVPHAGFAS